jgi:hypothetical protein
MPMVRMVLVIRQKYSVLYVADYGVVGSGMWIISDSRVYPKFAYGDKKTKCLSLKDK